MRPGITGFAQLRLTREMTWAEKLAHDFEYIADRSLRLYFEIVVARRRGSCSSRPVRPADLSHVRHLRHRPPRGRAPTAPCSAR